MRNWKLSQAQRASVELERRRRRAIAPRYVLLPHQVPPRGGWLQWILLSGRGGGKTFASAYYVDNYARANAGSRIAIIAPTLNDAQGVCVEGITGIRSFNLSVRFNQSKYELFWPNGSQGKCFSASTSEEAERLRGHQHHLVWFEEMAAARKLEEAWTNMRLGLRLGARPHAIISTTPRPRALLRELLDDPNTVVTRATTRDNPHLHESVRETLYRLYGGTRVGRQELDAEILDDNPGALWRREWLDDCRVFNVPDLKRIVVAVDPSVTPGGNEAGIVVVGVGEDGQGYVIDDVSMKGLPSEWARAAVAAYHKWHANRVVAETNQGGKMVEDTIKTVPSPSVVAYRGVHASRGKYTRAEPISALYEQGRVHHVGFYATLEDELCSWEPGGESPNRLDALVHGLTDLMIAKKQIEITVT